MTWQLKFNISSIVLSNIFSYSNVKPKNSIVLFSVSVLSVSYLESKGQCVKALTDISSLCRITSSLRWLGLFNAEYTSSLLTR